MAPKQKPGLSRQDYGTPPEFLKAVKHRLGITDFTIDLAASESNKVAERWYDESTDALQEGRTWNVGGGWAWCNPPFANITPWVEKAVNEMIGNGANICMLVPASTGSNWWSNWVDDIAHVIFPTGRLTFVGETAPYPKDCALLIYTPCCKGGYEVWDWRFSAKQA